MKLWKNQTDAKNIGFWHMCDDLQEKMQRHSCYSCSLPSQDCTTGNSMYFIPVMEMEVVEIIKYLLNKKSSRFEILQQH